MSDIDLDAIEARANAGVRQTPADADVLALAARVRELEYDLDRIRRHIRSIEDGATDGSVLEAIEKIAARLLNVPSSSSRGMGGDLR